MTAATTALSAAHADLSSSSAGTTFASDVDAGASPPSPVSSFTRLSNGSAAGFWTGSLGCACASPLIISMSMSSFPSRPDESCVPSFTGSSLAAAGGPWDAGSSSASAAMVSSSSGDASLAARANNLKNKLFFFIVTFLSGRFTASTFFFESKIATCFPALPRVTTAI